MDMQTCAIFNQFTRCCCSKQNKLAISQLNAKKKQISISDMLKSHVVLILDRTFLFELHTVFYLCVDHFSYYSSSERCITVTIISKSIIFCILLPHCFAADILH